MPMASDKLSAQRSLVVLDLRGRWAPIFHDVSQSFYIFIANILHFLLFHWDRKCLNIDIAPLFPELPGTPKLLQASMQIIHLEQCWNSSTQIHRDTQPVRTFKCYGGNVPTLLRRTVSRCPSRQTSTKTCGVCFPKMHICSPNIITVWPDRLQEIVFISAKCITWPSKAHDELCPSKRQKPSIHEAKYQSQSLVLLLCQKCLKMLPDLN